ncbi:hypothetical protein BS47DRAFT_1290936 [Hydnum rufescens UP504]|uniref:Uncharacterized protein n=1 Tax=Hydnum rufescens UP504 TaxID=1448309 RepID=A0A9P6B4H6_9AGAM|nr:hypothetical protein BS47DRAFT_1290936 [Hydnum rufescens UP504]
MSKRFASFAGPSSPSPTPVKPQPSRPQQGSPAPSSSLRNGNHSETTYHRKLRTTLLEIQSVTMTWNDLVLHDGLRAAKALVDARTELSNALAAFPTGQFPRTHTVGPKVSLMEDKLEELDMVLSKLQRCFTRLVSLVDTIDELLLDAVKIRGTAWSQEPLWLTWSLDRFASQIPNILYPYHRALASHINQIVTLRPHGLPFDKARVVINEWATQEWIREEGWDASWGELCEIEVGGWSKF